MEQSVDQNFSRGQNISRLKQTFLPIRYLKFSEHTEKLNFSNLSMYTFFDKQPETDTYSISDVNGPEPQILLKFCPKFRLEIA